MFLRGNNKKICALLAVLALIGGCGRAAGGGTEISLAEAPIREIAATERGTENVSVPVTEVVYETEIAGALEETAETETGTPAEEPEEPAGYENCYAYGVIPEEAKTIYNEILDCILEHKEEVDLSTLDEDTLMLAYDAVCADHGGLFWVSGYMYTKFSIGDQLTGITFAPKYTMDREERDRYQKEIDEAVESFLSGISITDPDYEKSKYVYETLIDRADYDESAPDNQNILSVFLNGRTVCQGYANATQYLLRQLGVESVVVTGDTFGGKHAWVAAKLDGDYYYTDTTFGNSMYSDTNQENGKYVNYEYLNVTTEELARDHTFDKTFTLPECIAVQDNYYRKEGLYFDTFEPDQIGLIIRTNWEGERSLVSIKCSDTVLYEEVFEYFITQQRIREYCSDLTSFRYADDPERQVLMIVFGS